MTKLFKSFNWLYVFVIAAVIAGSTVFGLYAENISAVLHEIRQNLFNSFVTGLVVMLAVVGLYLFLVKLTNLELGKVKVVNRFNNLVEWVFKKTDRLYAVIFLTWVPYVLAIFPGAAGWDLAMQVQEVVDNKGHLAREHVFAPSDVYPIAHYLVEEGHGLLTNQHNFFLTMIYGGVAKYSLQWFDSFVPGVAFLAVTQMLFTIFAFAYTLKVLGKYVKNTVIKLVAFLIVEISFLIPISGMDLNKNALFAAAFVLFLGIVITYLKGDNSTGTFWLLLITTVVILIAVKFGWMIIAAELVIAIFYKSLRKPFILALGIPLIIFKVSLAVLFSTGVVIEDDPIEAKGIQIQQVALYLREYPDDISRKDKAALNKIFNLKVAADTYNPNNTDPVKSSGYYDKFSYRFRTMKAKYWDGFNGIWLRMFAKHPSVFIRAAALKFYSYFDVFSPQIRDLTVTLPDFNLKGEELDGVKHGQPNDNVFRNFLDRLIHQDKGVISLLNSGVWFNVLGLIIIGAIIYRWAWHSLLIIMPFGVQMAAMIVSPLNGSTRYSLGFIFAFFAIVMLLFADQSVRNNKK